MTKPLIVEVVMASDWPEAFRLVWTETFKVAAADMGAPAPNVDIVIGELPSWSERRAICWRMGTKCAEAHGLPELACSWAALATDPAWPKDDEPAPERAKAFMPVLFGLADAIMDNESLLNDTEFGGALLAWRFMSKFGIGGIEDPILAARALAPTCDVDRSELLRWAAKWSRLG